MLKRVLQVSPAKGQGYPDSSNAPYQEVSEPTSQITKCTMGTPAKGVRRELCHSHCGPMLADPKEPGHVISEGVGQQGCAMGRGRAAAPTKNNPSVPWLEAWVQHSPLPQHRAGFALEGGGAGCSASPG